MNLPVTYIFTHDSIGVGEDGPTHQPIEHVASLRAMPNLEVIRPGDANEVTVLWKYIMESKDTPVALILSRQDMPVFDRTKYAPAEGALKGGYILADSNGSPDVILIATGTEVSIAVEAMQELTNTGVKTRVVSMPNTDLFDRQNAEYRESVLPRTVRARVAIEAGATYGWQKYTGIEGDGEIIGMTTFGASAKPNELYKEFGITKEAVVKAAKILLGK